MAVLHEFCVKTNLNIYKMLNYIFSNDQVINYLVDVQSW